MVLNISYHVTIIVLYICPIVILVTCYGERFVFYVFFSVQSTFLSYILETNVVLVVVTTCDQEQVQVRYLKFVLKYQSVKAVLLCRYSGTAHFHSLRASVKHAYRRPGPDHRWGWWGWSLRVRAPIGARTARYNENLPSRTTLGPEISRENWGLLKFLPSGISIRPKLCPYLLRRAAIIRSILEIYVRGAHSRFHASGPGGTMIRIRGAFLFSKKHQLHVPVLATTLTRCRFSPSRKPRSADFLKVSRNWRSKKCPISKISCHIFMGHGFPFVVQAYFSAQQFLQLFILFCCATFWTVLI